MDLKWTFESISISLIRSEIQIQTLHLVTLERLKRENEISSPNPNVMLWNIEMIKQLCHWLKHGAISNLNLKSQTQIVLSVS